MEARQVRRIKIRKRDESFTSGDLAGLVDFRAVARLLSWLSNCLIGSAPVLVGWFGVATMLGGLLWCALFILLQLEVFEIGGSFIFLYPDRPALFMLLVLFLCGLVGLRISQPSPITRLAAWGFALSVFGIVISMTALLIGFGEVEGLLNRLYVWYVAEWFSPLATGFMVLSVGLLLFRMAVVRTASAPALPPTLLVATSLFLQAPSIGWAFGLFSPQVGDVLYNYGVFGSLLVLHGIGWTLLGYQLFRNHNSLYEKPHA